MQLAEGKVGLDAIPKPAIPKPAIPKPSPAKPSPAKSPKTISTGKANAAD
jgi:hypothetical protein